jgi:hypothetical protein
MKIWIFMCRALVSAIALASLPNVAQALPEIHSIENGTVQVRRQGSGVYIYGRSRMPLQPRDALLPSQGARVRVNCSSGSRQPVTAGRLSGVRVICPDLARSTDPRDDDDLVQLLAGEVPYLPQVWLDMPTLTWPDVQPGEPYQVTVMQVRFVEVPAADPFSPSTTKPVETELHSATVTVNRWTYDGPILEPEGRYQLQITTSDDSETGSENDPESEIVYQAPFQSLTTEAAEALAMGIESLQVLDLAPVDAALALAYLYQEHDLYWKIVTLLQPLVAQGEATATVHYLLAESYLKTSNVGLAATHYGAAVTLGLEAEDPRTVAAAWVGMAKVAAAAQQPELTAQRLQMARQIYAELEVDEGWVATIDEWLYVIEPDANTRSTESES